MSGEREEGFSGGLWDLRDSSEVSRTKFGPGRVSVGVGLLLAVPGTWPLMSGVVPRGRSVA